MYVVGLTGGIGSGKTSVAEQFVNLGIDLVDADQVARAVVEPGSPALAAITDHFGDALIAEDGSLHRAELRQLVFAEESERLWLESLLHPLIRERLAQGLAKIESSYGLLVSPLLLETSQQELVDRILVVDIPEDMQLQRTLSRDGGDEQTVRAIMEAQMARGKRLALADDVIDNSGPELGIPARVRELHEQYLKLAACD